MKAAYNTPQIQAQLAFMYSRFTDFNQAVSLPQSFSGTSSPYQMASLYSTPPSNNAYYFTGNLGYNLTPRTRFNFNGRYGYELQNNEFPANNADPNLTYLNTLPAFGPGNLNALGQGTSATSPDIRAQVYQANVGVSSSKLPT